MKDERVVGGLRCSQVLARLSDYLDDELEPEERIRVETHVRGCDACARFGGAFASVVRSLRTQLGAEDPPAELGRRILEGL